MEQSLSPADGLAPWKTNEIHTPGNAGALPTTIGRELELHDVARRIFGHHWRLIACFVALGLAAAVLTTQGKTESYTGSTRLAFGTKDPENRAESESIADTAAAIATSPAQVRRALAAAHVSGRDADDVAEEKVSVQGLGSSGIVELSVSDRDPRVAAAISTALAREVIRARLNVTNGQLRVVLARLDRRASQLDRRIALLDRRPHNPRAVSRRDSLIQQRTDLSSARTTAFSADAQRPKPAIISAATPPQDADASGGLLNIALGGLLGLIVGVGIAALLETIRPTLVGRTAVAQQLDAPFLGALHANYNGIGTAPDTAAVTSRLGLAAKAARVSKVRVVSPEPDFDLGRLTGGVDPPLPIEPFSVINPPLSNGVPTGFVVVSPATLRRAELDEVQELLRIAPGPLLGVVTYPTEDGSGVRRLLRKVTELPRDKFKASV